MRRLIVTVFALWSALAGVAAAQNGPVVVELFTSQGCSSCPPADRLLAELADREDVIPLALHVDYWDYIGWKDKFAQAAFTDRQRGYARTGGWRTIYTPQMVIQGADDVVGSRPMKLMDIVQKHSAKPPSVSLEIAREGDRLRIRADALANGVGPAEVHVVRYTPSVPVKVLRGENAGKTLTYSHIVNTWDTVDRWNGRKPFDMSLSLSGDAPVVVLVQKPRHGAILAAARLR